MVLERHDRFERYSSTDLPFCIDREVPRCISTCPAGCDVKGYLELIAEDKYDEAYSLIKESIPFPGTLGRICDRPCEDECKRGFLDDPIAIRSLKRFAADNASRSNLEEGGEGGGKVVVLGAGPAGLTAAADLRKRGCEVTVLERGEKAGGMLNLIPEYELPSEILEGEIEELVGELGIKIERDCEVGEDVGIEELKEGYDAILVATGLPIGRLIDIEGSDLEGVSTALPFLDRAKSSEGENMEIGERALIIGGGNTAIDSARTACRMGADTRIVYRRSRKQMPADDEKVEAAEEEGVEIVFLASPSRIMGDGGVEEAEFDLMKLGEPDESGRKRPIPVEDSKITMEADNFIWAIGQASDVSFLDDTGVETDRGLVKADPVTLATGEEGIFAAGDIMRGPATAVEAIADGHRAAESIDRFLRGRDLGEGREAPQIPEESAEILEDMEEELKEESRTEGIVEEERAVMPKIGFAERERNFDEVEKGLPEDSAVREAERCLSCRICQLSPAPGGGGREIEIDEALEDLIKSAGASKCIDCGECTGSCPVASVAEGFSPRKLSARVMTGIEGETEKVIRGEDIWLCNTCGICNSVCPYGVDFVGFVKGLRQLATEEGSRPRFSESSLAEERIDDVDRLGWITDELEVAEEGEVYYFSGCLSFLDRVYDDRKNLNLLEIPRSTVKILNSIGIAPAVSEDEKCCGHDLLWMGEEEKVKDLAEANLEAIRKTGADTVVFTCPEGLTTFKEDYPRLVGDPGLEFVHISEFLADKDLPLREEWEEEILTFHDSCRLKDSNIYKEPRRILEKIPNAELVEMERTMDEAPCCGVNAMTTCGPVAKQLEVERLREAESIGASKLIVPCPKCWIHLDCADSSNPSVGNGLKIEEFTTAVARHLIPKS